jgi:hypothetical protein
MLQYECAREALKIGLKLEQKLGVNPSRFGMIGSTDSYASLATADEDNFFGKHSGRSPAPIAGRTHRHLQRGQYLRVGAGGIGLRRGVGHRELPRGHLRRHDAQGDLRHD